MLAIPNTQTTANYTDTKAAVFPALSGGGTPYVSGFVIVANASALMSICDEGGNWTDDVPVSPTLIPLSADRATQGFDAIYGIRFRDNQSGVHAQVFGALFQAGDPQFVPSSQFLGAVSGTGAFTPGSVISGTVLPFAGSVAPAGSVFCDGTLYNSVADPSFSNLFSIIGTQYGGTGASSFAVPDLRGRTWVALGSNASVNVLGASDGQAVANRRPQHRTSNALTFTGSAGVTGTENQAHNHNEDANTVAGSGGGAASSQGGIWGVSSGLITGTENQAHNHNFTPTGSITGSIGTNNGNDALDTPSFIVLQAIIVK